jgi:hypothetical protein
MSAPSERHDNACVALTADLSLREFGAHTQSRVAHTLACTRLTAHGLIRMRSDRCG